MTKLDQVAAAKVGDRVLLAVDEDAVRALEIDDLVNAVLEDDLGVITRHRAVLDDDVVVLDTSDDDLGTVEREFSTGVLGAHADDPRIVGRERRSAIQICGGRARDPDVSALNGVKARVRHCRRRQTAGGGQTGGGKWGKARRAQGRSDQRVWSV